MPKIDKKSASGVKKIGILWPYSVKKYFWGSKNIRNRFKIPMLTIECGIKIIGGIFKKFSQKKCSDPLFGGGGVKNETPTYSKISPPSKLKILSGFFEYQIVVMVMVGLNLID